MSAPHPDPTTPRPPLPPEVLEELSRILQPRAGFDLSHYRAATISRRTLRRMRLASCETLDHYLGHLRRTPSEQQALIRDLLISVTDFFRDPEAFSVFERAAVYPRARAAREGETLRAWVPACASGEEAYSLAILLLEAAEAERAKGLRLQLFATDVDTEALTLARRGVYPESAVSGISELRLRRFFTRVEDGFQVQPFLRDVVSFAVHNVCNDPPFSRMDFVSCRNLFIYLEERAREHVISRFHFALKPAGFLLLGSSETITGTQLTLVSKPARLYQKAGLVTPPPLGRPDLAPSRKALISHPPAPSMATSSPRAAPSVTALARDAVLRTCLPTLVLSEDGQILYSSGDLRPYVNLPQGEPRLELFPMLRADLVSRLRPAIYRSRRDGCQVSVVSSPDRGAPQTMMQVRPAPGLPPGTVVISFQDVESLPHAPISSTASAEHEVLLQQLEEELLRTREDLRHTIEEREAVNEELRTSHEEAVSMNEELQSANEELEATTEELRSLNEELSTLNAQLKEKVDELEAANNDLSNFFESTNLATVFLDAEFRIRRITPAAQELLQLGPSDTGRVVRDIARDLLHCDLDDDARSVHTQLSPRSRELRAPDGRWFVRRVLPYRTGSQHIGGVVVTFLDVTDLKTATAGLAVREEQQSVVARLSLQALEEEDIDAFMDRVVREVQQTLGTDLCELLELQPGAKKMLLRSGVGWRPGLVRSTLLDVDLNTQAGFILKSSTPIVVDDLASDKRFQPSPHLIEHRAASGIYCVIQFGDSAYGVLGALTLDQRKFTSNETSFLHSVATMVAAAVGRYQKRHRLALEHAVGWVLANSSSIADAAERIHGAFARELGTSLGELWWPDAHGETLTRTVFSPEEPHREHHAGQLFAESHITKGQGLVGRVWERGHPEWITVLDDHEQRELPHAASMLGLTAAMALPILSGTQVLGVLSVFSRRHLLADATFPRTLEAIGRAIGVFAGRLQAEGSLREANRQKDEFLAMLGHELRNPLAAVRSATELLHHTETEDDQVRRVRAVLQRQTAHMAKLLDGLLDVSRIVRGKIELEREPLDLATIARDVAKDYAAAFEGRPVRLDLELPAAPVWVDGDRIRLTQVLDNLLSNAAKYCRAGVISISVQPQSSEVALRVRDTGQGIEPELLPFIFDTFRQASQNMDRSSGGLGLGLPLVRGLVGLHGGSVSAASAGDGQGAEFVVRLPRAKYGPVIPESARPPEGHDRILIVEDNEDAAELLRELLELRGHATQVASNGQDALRQLETFVPDVILCDLGLPGMTGLEVALAVRGDSRFARVWLVALTGYGRPEDKARCEQAGFDAHITKPVSLSAIEHTLSQRSPGASSRPPSRGED